MQYSHVLTMHPGLVLHGDYVCTFAHAHLLLGQFDTSLDSHHAVKPRYCLALTIVLPHLFLVRFVLRFPSLGCSLTDAATLLFKLRYCTRIWNDHQ